MTRFRSMVCVGGAAVVGRLMVAVGATMVWAAVGSAADAPAKSAGSVSPNAAVVAEAAACADVLRSAAPYERKAAACKRLGEIGGKEHVAVLAPLLSDEKLSHPARRGLEAIPDAEAVAALRRALPALKGKPLVGVIQSLGVRRDAEATAGLVAKLGDADAAVAQAAARALGNIATPAAAQALVQQLPSASPAVRDAVGDGCLGCAETRLREGKAVEAFGIYEALRKSPTSKHVRAAAIRGGLLAMPSGAAESAASQLQDRELATFRAALEAVREIRGAEMTRVLAATLPRLAPERQVLLLDALTFRGDASARPAVLETAKHANTEVRAAALRALGVLGDASAVPVLLEAAVQSEPVAASAAQDALTAMTEPAIDAAVVEHLGKAQGKPLRFLFDLAGRRRIVAAVPRLKAAVNEPDAEVRAAAIRALGRTIAVQDLDVLTGRYLTPGGPDEAGVVREALKTACLRASDRKVCAERIAACFQKASPAGRGFLLELLGTIGGPEALRTVADAAGDADASTRDVAVQVLGKWNTPDAALPLLEVAKKSPDAKLRIRALRGYIRVFRQLDVPTNQRVAMGREAMAAAQRDEERVLTLEAAGRVRTPECLAWVASHLNTPALTESAGEACVTIGERIVATHAAPAADAANKVLQASKNPETQRRAREILARAGKK